MTQLKILTAAAVLVSLASAPAFAQTVRTPHTNWGVTHDNSGWNGYNNGGWSQQSLTIEGTVISDGRGNGFTLRAANGQTWQVQVQGAEPAGLSRGDVVRVFGPTRNSTVLATGLRILQNR